MSNLDSQFIRKLQHNTLNTEIVEKFENIFRDKTIFTPTTYSEESRTEKRERGNVKIIKIL